MILETIDQIEARLIATLQANPVLYDPLNPDPTKRGLTSPSVVSAWRQYLNTVATEIFTLQQLMSIFEAEVEGIVSLASASTAPWIKDKVINLFQYDATTPQILQVNSDGSVTYPVIDITKRLVTQCSVTTDPNKVVSIKVAKENPPVALVVGELVSLQAFLDELIAAGVQTNLISLNPDQLYVEANVFYNGQYSAVINANVIAAINAFLFAIPFNGIIKVSDLEETIRNVTGVTDVVLVNVKARDDGTPLGSAVPLVTAEQVIARNWSTIAGYIIGETTAGNTFADKINFIVG